MKGYPIYKGLQAPLVYKGFKGRYIYYGAGTIFMSFMIASITFSIFGVWAGLISFASILIIGFMILANKQKKGMYSKNKHKGIFVVVNKYKIRKFEEKTL